MSNIIIGKGICINDKSINTKIKIDNEQFKIYGYLGNEKVIWSGHLTSGDTKSCGCLHDDLSRERLSRHGKSRTRLSKNRNSI